MTFGEVQMTDQAAGIVTDHGYNPSGEPVQDRGDVLNLLSALLRHKAQCVEMIEYHQGKSDFAEARWLRLLKKTDAEIVDLLPEAFRLLVAIKSQVEVK